jgi:hypothetical protein
MADATYQFLSFVRSGFAASITEPDTLGSGQRALATAPVGVTVSGVAQPVTHAAVVRGPGDVIGIVRNQIVRTDPIDGAVGVEPNYFALIEFDRPDLPWLFTPAAATANEQLRPWIVLVVVDAEGPEACTIEDGSPLPRLHVPTAAAGQLQELRESHLWAHSQVLTDAAAQIDPILRDGDPRLTVSRLLCPRHLEPFTSYIAAVVPAFKVGVLAGLGQDVTEDDEATLDPAWVAGGEATLPVYHSFLFRTGEDADFEALARRLHGRPLPEGVGTRSLDTSRPGVGLAALPPPANEEDAKSIVWLDGALRPIDSDALPQRDAEAEAAFRTSLTVLLDRPAELVRGGETDAIVAPPIYGDKHALVVELGAGNPPPWIRELNLDVRTRVAAGLGTQVVQTRQEDFVARAWRQLGDVLAANRLLRAAQFARAAAARAHGRLAQLDPPSLLAVSAPAHNRVAGVAGAAVTMAKVVRDSRLPDVAVEPAFRRLARPSTAVARAAGVVGLSDAVVARFTAEAFAAPVDGPDGVSSMRPATEVIGAERASAALAAIGDASPGDAGRFDTVLTTLAGSPRTLPLGDEVRAATIRTDVGAVSVVTSLGAVPASAVDALLTAAAPPPDEPPPGHVPPGHVPPGHLPPVFTPPGHVPPVITPPGHVPPLGTPHIPHGLAGSAAVGVGGALVGRAGGLAGVIFEPPGVERPIGEGAILRGGAVVVDSDVVGRVSGGLVNVHRIDDDRWAALQEEATVPAARASADPVTDPGARLDAFRRDPGAIAALADVAGGNVGAAVRLDTAVAGLATADANRESLEALVSGRFEVALPEAAATITGDADRQAATELVGAVAAAFDRFVTIADAPAAAAGPTLNLDTARSGLLAKLDPEVTVSARVHFRLDIRTDRPAAPRDDLDPVMGSPVFLDAMWRAVSDLDRAWLLPGLELVPPDTATLVRTNPSFVAAHLVGLNHEFMRELLWRDYPTDLRGTAFKRFWGRSGEQPDDIGPVHLFSGSIVDNLLAGRRSEAVLLLRSELLRRYPGSIVYLCRARQVGDQLALDDDTIELPTFRGDLPPDVSFVGFAITPDELRGNGDPWWFVIAQPPAEPRFGLDDPVAGTPDVPADENELAWSHMSPDPATRAPFAIADPPVLRQSPANALGWGSGAAAQAHLTYQHPVRVAIRARDLVPPKLDGEPNQ